MVLRMGLLTSVVSLAVACNETEESRESPSGAAQGLVRSADEVHFAFVDDGSGAMAVSNAGEKGAISLSERERISALKPPVVAAPRPEPKWRNRLRGQVAGLDPNDAVELIVILPDQPFDWAAVRESPKDSAARLDLIEARRQGVASALQPLIERISNFALRVGTPHWIVPAFAVVVPQERVEEILAWVEPEEIGLNGPYDFTALARYTGVETRLGVRAADFLNYGYTGDSGGGASGRVRVGIVDSSTFTYGHPGFKRSTLLGWYSRIQAIWNCEHDTCSAYTPTQGNSHGSAVASIAVGSIEAGQDASITDPTQRVQRSGMSAGSDIYYYTSVATGTYADTRIALVERATADGVDVLNHSYSWNACTDCDPDCTGYGLTAAIRNSADAGVLNVFAIGNNGDVGDCTAVYPATIRHGLAIGALSSSDASQSYDELSMTEGLSGSSRGGMNIYSDGGWREEALAIADLVAPACHRYTYSRVESPPWFYYNYADSAWGCGTSMAAPVVTGSVALVKEALAASGYPVNNADVLLAHMLLMGDTWSSDFDQKVSLGMDQRSGAGRAHLWYPSSQDLTSPWGWGCHQFEISNGQTRAFSVGSSGPESTSVMQWKVALTFDEPDLMDAADIDLEVWDTCPEGGGEVPITADVSTDIRSRVSLVSYQIAEKCLEYRVYGWHVPQGETRTVSVCDYYHSGNSGDH
jgi:subtilisin family serine protease